MRGAVGNAIGETTTATPAPLRLVLRLSQHHRMSHHHSVFDTLHSHTRALSVALGYRDRPTMLHSERVLGIAHAIGLRCGLTLAELGALRVAATFHDVGKIGIPDHILHKPGRLDAGERDHMRQHSEIGEKIVAATGLPGADIAAQIIRHHHERFDGGGYPDGIAGESIPICSRIISIADSYDAMGAARSYQHARSHSEIMAILEEESGAKHDPAVFRVFCELVASNPQRIG